MNDVEMGNMQPGHQKLAWSSLLSRSYALYAERFWVYFRIAAIPAVVAYVFSYFEPVASRQLLRSGIFPFLSAKWVALAMLLGWIKGAVYWTISAFFFAAIAASWETTNATDAPAIVDAFSLPRKRLGAVAAVALFTWTLFFLGRGLSGLALFALLEHLGLARNFWAVSGSVGLMLLLMAGLLSRFGLAIPELMNSPSMSAGNAIRRSLKKREGWEFFFMMFLLKPATLAYGIYWVISLVLNGKWHHWMLNEAAYSWLEWIVYICIGAMLESPLFIAFSVLSRDAGCVAESALTTVG